VHQKVTLYENPGGGHAPLPTPMVAASSSNSAFFIFRVRKSWKTLSI